MKLGLKRQSINEIAKGRLEQTEFPVSRKYAFMYAKNLVKQFKRYNNRFKMTLRKW